MPHLQESASRVLSAVDEGKASAVITMYDDLNASFNKMWEGAPAGVLPTREEFPRVDALRGWFTKVGIRDVEYWLAFYGVIPKTKENGHG